MHFLEEYISELIFYTEILKLKLKVKQIFGYICYFISIGDNLVREDGEELVADGIKTDDSTFTTLTIGNIIGTFSSSNPILEFPFSIQLEGESGSILLEDESLTTPESSTKGKIMVESSASYAVTTFDEKEISTGASTGTNVDLYANNVGIETVADSILDFSEGNPFSEGSGY